MEYKYNYEEPSLNPIRQLIELSVMPARLAQFGMVNKRLNDFYKNNGITDKDNDIKNHMRHMGGSALFASPYWLGGRRTSKFWGDIKEGVDTLQGKQDTYLDLNNNQIGRDIAKQNPNLKTDELLDKVYQEVLRRYKSNQ